MQKIHEFMANEFLPPLIDEAGNVNHDATPYWSPIPWGEIAGLVRWMAPVADQPAQQEGFDVPAAWGRVVYAQCNNPNASGELQVSSLGYFVGDACIGMQAIPYASPSPEALQDMFPGWQPRTIGFWRAMTPGHARSSHIRSFWRENAADPVRPFPRYIPARPAVPGRPAQYTILPLPLPMTHTTALPAPVPYRLPTNGLPYQTASVNTSTSARNVQRTKTPHNRLPPGKGEKEKKTRATPAAFSRVGRFLSVVTEGADIIEAVYGALPEKIRQRAFAQKGTGRKLTPQEQLVVIYRNINQLDMAVVVANLAYNQIEDKIIGTVGKKIASKHQAWLGNRPVGFQTGTQGRSTPGVSITPL